MHVRGIEGESNALTWWQHCSVFTCSSKSRSLMQHRKLFVFGRYARMLPGYFLVLLWAGGFLNNSLSNYFWIIQQYYTKSICLEDSDY